MISWRHEVFEVSKQAKAVHLRLHWEACCLLLDAMPRTF